MLFLKEYKTKIGLKHPFIFEKVFIGVGLFIFIISLCIDLFRLPLWSFVISKFPDIKELYLVIFQVQATIGSLGIAVASIVGGAFDRRYYGISLTDYIVNGKSKYLKFKVELFIVFAAIVLSFVFLSYQLYNAINALFIITMMIITRLSLNVMNIYSSATRIKHEIKHI